MEPIPIVRLTARHAPALLRFYDELSAASIRTFHPLGVHTTLAACEAIARENATNRDTSPGEDTALNGAPATERGVPASENGTTATERGAVNAGPGATGAKFDLVALEGTHVVGWSFLWGLDTEEPLFGLAVADDYQGKGIGARLMDSVLDAARAMGVKRIVLTVVHDNERASSMYQRRGFAICEEFTDNDGLDYYRMRLELTPPTRVEEP